MNVKVGLLNMNKIVQYVYYTWSKNKSSDINRYRAWAQCLGEMKMELGNNVAESIVNAGGSLDAAYKKYNDISDWLSSNKIGMSNKKYTTFDNPKRLENIKGGIIKRIK